MTHYPTAAELREAIRRGRFRGPTAGQAPGYVQANLVVLPASYADDFAEFCRLNPRPCPLLERLARGSPAPTVSAPLADLRTDVPLYRVFRHGIRVPADRSEIASIWRDDFTAFLLGCSFTFDHALTEAGLTPRHVELGRNVPMYRTNRPCRSAGPFAGPLVVSMRPYRPDRAEEAARISGLYPDMHGAPIHTGDPSQLGIRDVFQPDFGDEVPILEGETPLFWACGVTPQLALAAAAPDLVVTHSPGHMFVTDRRDEEFRRT